MAVYTHLTATRLAALIAEYDVGDLIVAEGIAQGISNSNWMIDTTRGRFVLTVYERRIDTTDLPFFLDLLDHLSAKGCAVPRTIHGRDGQSLRSVEGKAAALIEFLPGTSPSQPTPQQAHAVGAALAQVHLAAQDFPMARADPLDPQANVRSLGRCGAAVLASIDPALPEALSRADALIARLPVDLPASIVHADLFPDNVLMHGDRVTGLIDFYFACSGAMAYDLAVTHAAWSFDARGEVFDRDIGAALVAGYETIRTLDPGERAALPSLAQAACLRFVASRAQDWLDTPVDAIVTRKDPMDFLRRWRFYADADAGAFA